VRSNGCKSQEKEKIIGRNEIRLYLGVIYLFILIMSHARIGFLGSGGLSSQIGFYYKYLILSPSFWFKLTDLFIFGNSSFFLPLPVFTKFNKFSLSSKKDL
jgi:hypothetical protein